MRIEKWTAILAVLSLGAWCCGTSNPPPPIDTGDESPSNDGGSGSGSSSGGASGSGSGSGSTNDSGSGTCNPTAAFGAPVALPDLSSTSRDDGLSLSPDGLTAYLASQRAGGDIDHLFTAIRIDDITTFETPTLLAGIEEDGGAETDFAPRISTDGLRLYLASTRGDSTHIFLATRTATSAQFQAPQLLPGVNSESATVDKDEYLTPDETNLYFTSNRLGGDLSLFWTTLTDGGADGSVFGTPTELTTLVSATPSNDLLPVITADQLTIFFASDRADTTAVGSFDIWAASRTSTASPFGPPVNVAVLNTPELDYPLWLSSNGCTLYIASGPADTMHFFEATRGD